MYNMKNKTLKILMYAFAAILLFSNFAIAQGKDDKIFGEAKEKMKARLKENVVREKMVTFL